MDLIKQKEFNSLFELVYEKLKNTNFISYMDLEMNPNLRLGLFCVMTCYHVGFSHEQHGGWRWIHLKNGEDGAPLTTEELRKLPFDMDEHRRLYHDFVIGAEPFAADVKIAEKKKPSLREFGWLSPTGEFTESPFGTHEESAELICINKKIMDEKKKWSIKVFEGGLTNEVRTLARDFLVEVKGYALVHSPAMQGYVVTHQKPLTKKQKSFLYDYFMDVGDVFMAEEYLPD